MSEEQFPLKAKAKLTGELIQYVFDPLAQDHILQVLDAWDAAF
jgi:hypothetical protein